MRRRGAAEAADPSAPSRRRVNHSSSENDWASRRSAWARLRNRKGHRSFCSGGPSWSDAGSRRIASLPEGPFSASVGQANACPVRAGIGTLVTRQRITSCEIGWACGQNTTANESNARSAGLKSCRCEPSVVHSLAARRLANVHAHPAPGSRLTRTRLRCLTSDAASGAASGAACGAACGAAVLHAREFPATTRRHRPLVCAHALPTRVR